MAGTISPADACAVAKSAYTTNTATRLHSAAASKVAGSVQDQFEIAGGDTFQGVTGADRVSNFGYVALGKGTRQGEALIAVRGTEFNSVNDWLTNGNCAMVPGPGSWPVHAGFNNLTKSILPQVKKALTNNPSTLHIVGHSLGGAAAVLLADALSSTASVKLYTFGAPRAGSLPHSASLTKRVSEVHRVYHDADPVPMVPVFPYTHAPTDSSGYLLAGKGGIINIGDHDLNTYASSVGGATWNSMPVMPHRRFSVDTVDDVLKSAGQIPGGFLSSLLMRLIAQALGLILKGAGILLANAAQGIVTVLDQLTVALIRGARIVGAGIELLESVARQIMRFLGIAVKGSIKITTQFLRWILGKLFATIATIARNATQRLIM